MGNGEKLYSPYTCHQLSKLRSLIAETLRVQLPLPFYQGLSIHKQHVQDIDWSRMHGLHQNNLTGHGRRVIHTDTVGADTSGEDVQSNASNTIRPEDEPPEDPRDNLEPWMEWIQRVRHHFEKEKDS